jgi:hypothetical protein
MTAAERLLALSKATGAAGALLLAIGSGATAEAALLDYSALGSVTAAEHLLYEKVAGGGIGHGKKKLRWIERDGKILIFKTPEEVELFIDIENRNTEEPLTESEPVNIIKPVEVIDKVEIKQLSKAYNYQRKLYHADQVGNIERVIAIYRELQQREEDDIELILIGS